MPIFSELENEMNRTDLSAIRTQRIKRLAIAAALAVGTFAAGSAVAQRDPAYQAAREAGQVGEQPDGYLGHATPPTPEIRALVLDLNIKRKDAYTRSAAESGATVEQFAFTTGCNLILRTKPGEKYQAPDGRWMTRGEGAPVRDPRCP
jgi:uncharacterized protein YdbL (DUF1318 family)